MYQFKLSKLLNDSNIRDLVALSGHIIIMNKLKFVVLLRHTADVVTK